RQHGRHAPAFHGWSFFDLGQVNQLFEDGLDNPLTFLDVLHLPAFEEHVHQYLVFVLEESPGLIDFGIDVVVARLGADADFLEFLLVRLVFVFLPRLLVTELAEVHDLAHRWPLGGGNLHKIPIGFAGHFHGLSRRHDAQLLTIGPDQPHGTDANLFIDSLMLFSSVPSVVVGTTVARRRNTWFSFQKTRFVVRTRRTGI